MINVGIECESIEDQAWGVGRIIEKLLQEIDRRSELKNEFKFFLYFKTKIPDLPYLKNSIFEKKIVGPNSFSLYYYVFLPIKLWFENLDLMYFPNYMLPIILNGKSLVTLTPDIYFETYHGSLPLRYKMAYRIFGGWAAKHATRIVSVLQAAASEVASMYKIKQEKIVVVPNGVEFHSVGNESISQNEKYILYVGQAFPRRHLRETILAFEKLTEEFNDLKLIAIGSDKYNPPIIQKLIQDINRKLKRECIIQKDYVSQDELWNYYRNAEAVVYISSKEAFGLPPLEGLAAGSVPVVSDDMITREIFEDDAFFVKDPDSVEDIVFAIRDALTNKNKREQIQKNSPAILNKYTWQKHTDSFLSAVREVSTL